MTRESEGASNGKHVCLSVPFSARDNTENLRGLQTGSMFACPYRLVLVTIEVEGGGNGKHVDLSVPFSAGKHAEVMRGLQSGR